MQTRSKVWFNYFILTVLAILFINGDGYSDIFIPPECSLDQRFEETTLTEGTEYYTDRTYTLASVPSQYVGMLMIKTPNDDRNRTDPSDYMTFEVEDYTYVYVAFDRRASSLPDWMGGFTDTGETITTSLSSQGYLKVYRKMFSWPNNCVNLGASKAPGFSGGTVSNYIVFSGEGGPCDIFQPGPDWCRDCGPCPEGQGDCDGDGQCQSGLICAQDVGADYGWPAGRDVCEMPAGTCDIFQPGPDWCRDCGPCPEGQGDCDGDAECQSGLICAQDVGANYGWPPSRDVCERP